MAQSSVEKQRAFRERKRAEGKIPVQYWIHPDDRAKLDKYVAKLLKQRGAP